MTRALGAVLLGAAMLAGGLAFGSPSLFVPAVALLALGLGAAVWVNLAAAGAGLERRPGPPTAEEGRPWPLVLEVRRGLLPPPGGELVEPILGHPLSLRRAARRIRVDVNFDRRGRRTLEAARATIRDPLGLAERRLETDTEEVLVLPRVEALVAPPGGGAGRFGVRAARPLAEAAELEIDGLRPYRPGASASRIHWPAVARRGEMVERRLIADADARPLIVLDARRPASLDALDRAVRAAASLAVHMARYGGCALLLPGDRRATDLDAELRAWPALHVRLALVEPDERAPSAGRVERTGAVIWVMAAPGGPPAGLARAGAAERWLVTPTDSPPRGAGFTVAGCAGRLLGGAGRRAA
jgi:uncharacterized protein (DUF58 family)